MEHRWCRQVAVGARAPAAAAATVVAPGDRAHRTLEAAHRSREAGRHSRTAARRRSHTSLRVDDDGQKTDRQKHRGGCKKWLPWVENPDTIEDIYLLSKSLKLLSAGVPPTFRKKTN